MSSFLGDNMKNEPEVIAEMMKLQVFGKKAYGFICWGSMFNRHEGKEKH